MSQDSEDSVKLDTFPGARYWRSMQGSVDAILIPMGIKRRVISMGYQFVNYDRWTAEAFAHHLCHWWSKQPKALPSDTQLRTLISEANSVRCPDPHIRVAKMPDRVTYRLALGIVGGGYHEAWHTKYSKRDRVTMADVQPLMEIAEQVILAGGAFDAKMRGLLMTMHHLIEDIRIERRGNEDFEGAKQAMCDLQDFILELESKARAKGAKVKNVTVTTNARSILLCAFRDLGLGYNTHMARKTLEFYKETAPGAVGLLAPGGLLHPMLHEAKMLARDDGMGSLRVAMKVVVELWRAMQEDAPQEANGLSCPSCGAGPKDLIIRSVKNAEGVKIRGVAELECKACGYKTQFPLPDNSLNLNQQKKEQKEPEEQPEIEDLDNEDVGEGGDGFGDDQREQVRDAINEGKQETSKADSGETGESSGDEDDEEGPTHSMPGDAGEEDSAKADGGDDESGDDEESAAGSGGSDDTADEDSEEPAGAVGSSDAGENGDDGDEDGDDKESTGASSEAREDDGADDDGADEISGSASGDDDGEDEDEGSGTVEGDEDRDGDDDWDDEDEEDADEGDEDEGNADEGDEDGDDWEDADESDNDDDWDDADEGEGDEGEGEDDENDEGFDLTFEELDGLDNMEQGDTEWDPEDDEGGDEGDWGDEEGDGGDRSSGKSQEGDTGLPEDDDVDPEDEDWEMDGEDFIKAAGGPNLDLGRDPRSSMKDADEVLDGDEKDGAMNNQKAIEQALAEQQAKDLKDRKAGERVWNPFNPMLDEARIVRTDDQAGDTARANVMLQEVRQTITFLRTRLRTIVKAQEMTDTVHGVRRGRKLSDRRLVDTAIDIRTGSLPKRAYQDTETQIDTSFALSVCLDESGSMCGSQREVAKCMMAMIDAVDGIRGKSFAFGFRNGVSGNYGDAPQNWDRTYHRIRGIRYDVFKTWEESFSNTKWRFAHTQARGTTPMSDGIQFGLQALNERNEAHRVLAVVTDGCPDGGHEEVIRRQIRIAREGGLHMIGIGIGEGAEYVLDLFGVDNAIWVPKVEVLPTPLLKKLNELCDFTGRFRGRRAKLDGKVTRRVS